MKVTLHFNSEGHVGDGSQSLFLMLSLNLIFSLDLSLSLSDSISVCRILLLSLPQFLSLLLSVNIHSIIKSLQPICLLSVSTLQQSCRN